MDADAKTGDGAGVLTQIPYKLFRPEVEKMGYKLFQDSDLGVGMMFLPNDPYTQARCRHITEVVLSEHKLFIFGWRVGAGESRRAGREGAAHLSRHRADPHRPARSRPR